MERKGRYIPNRLRKYRRIRGYTQTQIKQMLGVKKANRISRWEKGTSIPSLENLLLLYLLYHAPIEELYAEYLEELRIYLRSLQDGDNQGKT